MSESIQNMFKIHRKRFNNELFNIFVKKRYFQSEFTVSFIAYIDSRLKFTFERKYKSLYLLKTTHTIS